MTGVREFTSRALLWLDGQNDAGRWPGGVHFYRPRTRVPRDRHGRGPRLRTAGAMFTPTCFMRRFVAAGWKNYTQTWKIASRAGKNISFVARRDAENPP